MTREPHNIFKAECVSATGQFSFSRLMDNESARFNLEYLSTETECAIFYGKIKVNLDCSEDGDCGRENELIDWPMACVYARKKTVSV